LLTENAVLVDLFTLALTHGLMAIALWRLLSRDDLGRDPESEPARPKPWARNPRADGTD
jgi:hypothetical protein